MKTTTKKAATRKSKRQSGAKRRAAPKPALRASASQATAVRASIKTSGGEHATSVRAMAKSTARATGKARRSQLVIDATNVICGPQTASRLDLLLSLVAAVAGQGSDVLCIFDATTPHRLHSSPERDLYRWLLQYKSNHFVQCPGRTQADALILAEADRMRCPVVSNDFFRDREERYPWVRDKGRVLRHQPIRDVIYLGDTALPVETDLALLRSQIDSLLP